MCFSRLGSENEKRFGGGVFAECQSLDWSINYSLSLYLSLSLSLSKVRFFRLYNQNLRFHTPKGKQERASEMRMGNLVGSLVGNLRQTETRSWGSSVAYRADTISSRKGVECCPNRFGNFSLNKSICDNESAPNSCAASSV